MNALQAEIDAAVEKHTKPLMAELVAMRKMVQAMSAEPTKRLNVEQAAEYLGIKPDTLRRKINTGQIPAKRVGNRWFFNLSDLAKFENS